MKVCELIRLMRLALEPLAQQHGLAFSIAPDPQAPYTAITNAGAAGLCILCYSGQGRIDDTPRGRIPVGSRFELFICKSVQLSPDKSGGGALFRPDGAQAPLYAICEEFEDFVKDWVIPVGDDRTVEQTPYYDATDPVVMPDGYVLNAYKIAYRIRRAM
jgi:hypothetical protein